MTGQITDEILNDYIIYLKDTEKSYATIEKYIHNIKYFNEYINHRDVLKSDIVSFREHLLNNNYSPVTVNGYLASLNNLFNYLKWFELNSKYLKVQKKLFRDADKDLDHINYLKLIKQAIALKDNKSALIMETICSCGIRVSELIYITVEALKEKKALIKLKGKVRLIFINNRLADKLLKYIKKHNITSGSIFLKDNKPISRQAIWYRMKKLAESANINKHKVFPHNLRHLFALMFYKFNRNIVRLSSLLGHSSIETTKIYLLETSADYYSDIDKLKLVL